MNHSEREAPHPQIKTGEIWDQEQIFTCVVELTLRTYSEI